MRQHSIPQNVLDVEFKLFTKFTLREFAFLAIGVGGGGFFLFLTSKGVIPGIIGVPIFIILSGIGAFLGLVPINDQPADKFIINYFSAINKPTQRVWLNKELKEERAKPLVTPEKKKTNIIAGAKLDRTDSNSEEDTLPDEDIFKQSDIQTKTENIQAPIDTGPKLLDNSDNLLVISDENISKYQFQIKSIDKLPGNINIWLSTKSNQPIPNVNTYLKDNEGKILYANRTGPNGYFLTNKEYSPGIYNVEFEGDSFRGPGIKLVLTKETNKLPLRIISK